MSPMKKILTALVSLLFFTANLDAQVDMTWDTHGVGFKVPRGFVIKTNNAEEFTAENDDVFVTIVPIQDKDVSVDDLADVVAAMVKEMDYDLVTDGDAVDVHNFTGHYARGSKDGANAIIMALLDPDSATNLIVAAVYTGDFEDQALMIVNSFYSY